MLQTPYSFPKSHRLKGQKNIEYLLRHARACNATPFRILWHVIKSEAGAPPVQVAISVSKKNIPKAVHRNVLKRRFREAYRTSCMNLVNKALKQNIHLQILFIYRSSEIQSYSSIREAVVQALQQIEKKI